MSTIRVVIVFHNRLLRDSIARILGKRTEFEVVAAPNSETLSLHEGIEDLSDVLLLDSLEYLFDSARQKLEGWSSRAFRPLLLAMEDDPSLFLRAVRRGAWGYVLQDASAADVVAAVRSVAQGQAVCPPQFTRFLFEYIATQTEEMPSSSRRKRWGLTRREQQLVPLIERGLSNKEIAGYFHLSEQTVKNHIHRILRKTGVSDRLGIGEVCRDSVSPIGTESSTQPKFEVSRVLS